jgi:ketosteroid isomerase-like protein
MRIAIALALLLAALSTSPLVAQPAGPVGEVTSVIDAFHAALSSGSGDKVLELLAEDAVMLEAGGVETRAQYAKDHLPADIEFEKTVVTKRSPLRIIVAGATAWATSTTETTGTYRGRPVDTVGAESMVLSKESAGWRIRAIHWSSRARRPAP